VNLKKYLRFARNVIRFGALSSAAIRALVFWPHIRSIEEYLKNPTEITRTREGFYIYTNPLDDVISLGIAQTGRFVENEERQVTEIFKSLIERSSLVVDVGANIGWYTLLAAKRARKVYSFEPSPVSFSLLQRSVSKNGFKNVAAYPYCVSEREGSVTLHLADSGNKGLHSIVRNIGSQTIEVRSVTIDSMFPSETIDLMKIDVEGAELLVLLGAHKMIEEGRLRRIVMEWNPWASEAWQHNHIFEKFNAFCADQKTPFTFPRGIYNRNVFLVAK
jgi:FkbM family methyltransferase